MPCFRKFITVFTKISLLDPIMSQFNSAHIFTNYFYKISLFCYKQSNSKKKVCISLFPMRATHRINLIHLNLIILNISSLCTFLHSAATYLRSNFILGTLRDVKKKKKVQVTNFYAEGWNDFSTG
jgi:hypothetical protein